MQDWNLLSRSDQARRLIAILAELSLADGEVQPAETSFLTQLGQQYGVDAAPIVSAPGAADSAPALLPTAEADRMRVLYYLLFLSRADREVKDSEEAVLHRYGLRLGIRPALVADFVSLAREHRDGDIPPEEMLGRIRAYLN